MSRVMEFGIMAVFQSEDGRLTVQPQMLFACEEDAKRAAEIFAEVLGGAVAFSRVVDRETGLADDGVIIAKFGVMADPSSEDSAYAGSPTFPRHQARPPIRDNPERYILTFFEAQLRLCALARVTRRERSEDFARMRDEVGEMKLHLPVTTCDVDGCGHLPSTTGDAERLAREARSLPEVRMPRPHGKARSPAPSKRMKRRFLTVCWPLGSPTASGSVAPMRRSRSSRILWPERAICGPDCSHRRRPAADE
jgi:hypothetical protein